MVIWGAARFYRLENTKKAYLPRQGEWQASITALSHRVDCIIPN